MRFVTINQIIPNTDALDALYEALVAAVGAKYIFTSTGEGKVIVALADNSTPTDDTTVTQVVLTHDYNLRTAAQQAVIQRKADFQSMVTTAQQALLDIDAEITLLNGTPTNAQVIGIVKAEDQRIRAIIKAILRIADTIS
jgi:hypothetical protein